MPLAPPGDTESGTSHFSIVDARGDIVSMTTTIEAAFGSRIMVRGFLLNNQLTDFDFMPGGANAVAPRQAAAEQHGSHDRFPGGSNPSSRSVRRAAR